MRINRLNQFAVARNYTFAPRLTESHNLIGKTSGPDVFIPVLVIFKKLFLKKKVMKIALFELCLIILAYWLSWTRYCPE